jgi:Peptidase family M48
VGARCRSAHSNAYFFGLGKNKRIVLYDTLVEQCSPAQIVAVLAHELGVSKRLTRPLYGYALKVLYVMQHLPLLPVMCRIASG